MIATTPPNDKQYQARYKRTILNLDRIKKNEYKEILFS